jgi:hypothetical protein
MDLDRKIADWKASGNYHLVIGMLFGMAGVGGVSKAGLPGAPSFGVALAIGAILGGAIGYAVGHALLAGSERAAESVYMPRATGTYTKTHSGIDAMEARGDVRGAASAWDSVSVEEPGNPWPLIRAGELYFRKLDEPALALERFQLARRIPGIHDEQHRYAISKIVDLYLGPMNDRGRALVELRRLIEEHPGTREAAHAREALAKLKAQG